MCCSLILNTFILFVLLPWDLPSNMVVQVSVEPLHSNVLLTERPWLEAYRWQNWSHNDSFPHKLVLPCPHARGSTSHTLNAGSTHHLYSSQKFFHSPQKISKMTATNRSDSNNCRTKLGLSFCSRYYRDAAINLCFPYNQGVAMYSPPWISPRWNHLPLIASRPLLDYYQLTVIFSSVLNKAECGAESSRSTKSC